MKTLRSLITGLVLLGNLLMLAALSFHVIVAPGKVGLVAKDHLTMIDTYRDVRGWSPVDVATHPALLSRLTDAGRLDLISHVSPAPQPEVRTQTSSTAAPMQNSSVSTGVSLPAALVNQVQIPATPAVVTSTPKAAATPTTRPAGAKSSIFDFGQ